MFENLIAQEETVRVLSSDIAKGELPPSLLFAGPENAGKLTAALETARVLSCESDRADWGCACRACASHRLLAHPDLLLVGPRSFRAEILAAGELLERGPNRAARFLFYRAIRKLTRRFDPVLYEGEENRLGKSAPLVQALEELADEISPERDLPLDSIKAAEKALPLADKLEALLPDSIPIFQVRAVERWARLAPLGRHKIVVIENSERMLEGSRNALLKILEEPPETTHLILLSARPAALIPTILSRVRAYTFAPRDAEASRMVLSKVFHTEGSENEDSLDSFLAARKPLSSDDTDGLALRFMAAFSAEAADSGRPLPPFLLRLTDKAQDSSLSEALNAIFAETKGFGSGDASLAYVFPAFLRSLAGVLRTTLRAPDTNAEAVDLVSRWAGYAREALLRYDAYNLSSSALTESLAERMLQAAGRAL